MKVVLLTCLLAACTDVQNVGYTGAVTATPTPAVGAARWALALGGAGNDRARGVGFLSSGDVVIAVDEAPLDPADDSGTLGAFGAFVTRRAAADGSEQWTVPFAFGDSSYCDPAALAIDSQDNVIVVGAYWGTVDFGGQQLVLPGGNPPDRIDTFIAKLAPDGHALWARGLTPYADSSSLSVAIGPNDAIVVTGGVFDGTAQLGTASFSDTSSDQHGYVVELDSDGSVVWGNVFGPGTQPENITVTAAGDLAITGSIAAPTTIGSALLDPGGQNSAPYVARFSSAGAFESAHVIATPGDFEADGLGVAAPSAGMLLVQTSEMGSASLGDSAVHAYDGAGNELWASTIPNHGSFGPPIRTLLTTNDGRILSTTWNDAPYNADHPELTTGSLEVVSFDALGTPSTTTLGERMMATPAEITVFFRATAAPDGELTLGGQLGGTIDVGTGPVSAHGSVDVDAFVVVVDQP